MGRGGVEWRKTPLPLAVGTATDAPPWLPDNADMGDVNVVRQNHSIDQDLKAGFEALDSTRPALPASGETDVHLRLGWGEGAWKDVVDTQPLIGTAVRAPSPPSIRSPRV